MEPSFAKLLALLAEGGVEFVLVGGLAVTLQGYVRFTEDVDILIEDDEANVSRLLSALADYGEGFAKELAVEDFTDEEGAIRIVEVSEMCQLNVFTRMSGRKYRDVLEDAAHFEVRGFRIPYASKASLIGWKSSSVREKDKLDAMALRRLEEDPRAFD